MGRISKFNNEMRCRLLEYASLGYNLTECAKLMGVHRNTLTRWIKNNDLQRHIDDIEQDLMRGTIKRGLIALAEGVKIEEEQIKSIESDDAGKPIEITRRVKNMPPSEKAIQILAAHYDKRFGAASSDSEHKSITHDINVNIMSQRELAELRQLNPLGAIDAEYHEVASDIPSDTEQLLEGSDILVTKSVERDAPHEGYEVEEDGDTPT